VSEQRDPSGAREQRARPARGLVAVRSGALGHARPAAFVFGIAHVDQCALRLDFLGGNAGFAAPRPRSWWMVALPPGARGPACGGRHRGASGPCHGDPRAGLRRLAERGRGKPVLPLGPLFDGIAANPAAPEYWWVYVLLLSTMIPRVINLAIGGVAPMRGEPRLSSMLLQTLRPYDEGMRPIIPHVYWSAPERLGRGKARLRGRSKL
jgi:hypothetical protein